MTTNIQVINDEVSKALENKETLNTLVSTTFKGLNNDNVKRAMIEGMMRGFKFDDFLEKNIYAIPFTENKGKENESQTYSLVTSIDYARKVGMRSGIIGKSEPFYEEKEGRIISCSIKIKRKVGTDIGEFSSKVFFSEFTTGRNLWTSKPRMMIAKVAEMHALRMACPEELSQMYTVEEMEQNRVFDVSVKDVNIAMDLDKFEKKLSKSKDLKELKANWDTFPQDVKTKLTTLKDDLKKVLL